MAMRILLVFIILLSQYSFSQNFNSDPDFVSYTWYLGGEWDSLVLHRKELVKASGQEYFYLRYRIGVAAFNLKQYRIAIDELQRASQLNSGDTSTLKYLEASLLEMGRVQEALIAGQKLTDLGAQKLSNLDRTKRNCIIADIGVKQSNIQDIGNLKYAALGLGIYPSNKLYIYAAYSGIRQTKFNEDISQKVLSTSFRWQQTHGISITAHFSLLNISLLQIQTPRENFRQEAGGIGIRKSIANWDLDAHLDFGNLNDDKQVQETFGLTYFPFGNTRLSLQYQLALQQQNGINNFIHKPTITLGLSSKVWLSGEFYRGNTRNVIENTGMLINNSFDITQSRTSVSLIWIPNSKFSGYLTVSHEQRTESEKYFNYTFNGIFAGIKISPW